MRAVLDVAGHAPDQGTSVHLPAVPSSVMRRVLDFCGEHAQCRVRTAHLRGLGTGIPHGDAPNDGDDHSDAADAERPAVLMPKALPLTLDLHEWGLPVWTVWWLDALRASELLRVLRAAEVVRFDALYLSACAKVAALHMHIPHEVHCRMYERTDFMGRGASDDPASRAWEDMEFVQYQWTPDPAARSAQPVQRAVHVVSGAPDAQYTEEDFLAEWMDAVSDAAFATIASMT